MDLTYPKHLFEDHKDFPLCPEKLEITEDMLCHETRSFLKDNDIKYTPQTRLTPTFLPKTNYVLHISNLKFYLKQGMVLDKIHKGVKFLQTNWLKEYVDFNTEKRKLATSDFEKDFFKLLVIVYVTFNFI